jgi:hypothetical protein
MKHRLVTAGILAALFLVALSAAPAEAASPSAAVRTEQKVSQALKLHPGWQRIGTDSVRSEDGMVMTFVPATRRTGQAGVVNGPPTGCNYKNLCVYANAQDFWHGGGWYAPLYDCDNLNLGHKPFPDGGYWNDKISAIYNHQTPGTTSDFYDYSGHGTVWIHILAVSSGNYLLNLANNRAEDGGPLNDRIDGIHVCGYKPNPWQPAP